MVELHCHLDGSIRESVITKFLGYKPTEIYFYKGMGLEKALQSFQLTLGTLQTCDLVKEAVFNLLNQNNCYEKSLRYRALLLDPSYLHLVSLVLRLQHLLKKLFLYQPCWLVLRA